MTPNRRQPKLGAKSCKQEVTGSIQVGSILASRRHLLALNWHRRSGPGPESTKNPCKRITRRAQRLPEESCKSALSHGFSGPSENRGVPGSIPGLAIFKDAAIGRLS